MSPTMADFVLRMFPVALSAFGRSMGGFSDGRAPPLVDFVLGAGERPAGQAEALSPTGCSVWP
jgi:hypothetical protein